MTRTIKVSEVRPGMEVQWTSLGITRRCTGEVVDAGSPRDGVNLRTSEGGAVHIPGDAEVTVLTEPQPEEPTAFGARVTAGGRRFVRGNGVVWPWIESLDGELYDWRNVCDEGEVTIIDADPSWTAPAGREPNPEVPDRIEVWPEDDEHLRNYEWLDTDGHAWRWHWAEDGWGYNHATFPQPFPECFPMTRVADA